LVSVAYQESAEPTAAPLPGEGSPPPTATLFATPFAVPPVIMSWTFGRALKVMRFVGGSCTSGGCIAALPPLPTLALLDALLDVLLDACFDGWCAVCGAVPPILGDERGLQFGTGCLPSSRPLRGAGGECAADDDAADAFRAPPPAPRLLLKNSCRSAYFSRSVNGAGCCFADGGWSRFPCRGVECAECVE